MQNSIRSFMLTLMPKATRFFLLALLTVPLTAQELSPSQVFEKVKTSVVVVKSFDVNGQALGLGSGVKLPSGRIVTNSHVVQNGSQFLVGHGEAFVVATIYARDAEKDLCLLEAPAWKAPSVVLGSTSTLKVGATVYAIGSPQGLELSLSNGLVSQLRGAKPPIIQTTAAISPGSSGGGLFDSQGRLVGITSFYIEGGQNLNFALPVEWIEQIKLGLPQRPILRSKSAWLAQAVKLEQDRNWAGLLAWTQAWVEVSSKDADAWAVLGSAYVHLNCCLEGIDAIKHALEINPEHAYAWNNLGIAYDKAKRPLQAVDAYRTALQINSEDAASWNNLGLAYDTLCLFSEAINAHRQSLRINPDNAEAWSNAGETYRHSMRYSEAIDAYRRAIKIKPTDGRVWINLGSTHQSLSQYTEAIEAYRQALKINPENAMAWDGLGNVYTVQERYPEAIDAHRQSLKINPGDATPWYNLGNTYLKIRRYSEASDAYRQVLKINPESALAWSNLGIVYALSGNKSAALDAVNQLRRFDSEKADRLFDLIVPK